MANRIIRDKEHDKLTVDEVIVHNQCVIHDILMGLFEAVDKAGLGFVYGKDVAEAQKKFKEFNDSVRPIKKKPKEPKKEEKKDPNKELITPERHKKDVSLTPL